MDNYDVFNFQSIIACQILSFLQVCIPVISGHSLLLLSIQRYRLVCKPLSKNDFFLETGLIWNCVFYFGRLFGTRVGLCRRLSARDVVNEPHCYSENVQIFIQTVAFNEKLFHPVVSYNGVNLVITAGLYIPILKQVRSLLFSKTLTYKKYRQKCGLTVSNIPGRGDSKSRN